LAPSGIRPRAIWALVRRDFAVTRSYRLAFYLDIGLGVIDLCIYFFISKTFPQTTADLGGAPSYFAFAAVGLAMTIVIGATSTQLAQRVREEQLTGTLEALTVQPLSATELSLGMGGLPFLFALVRVAVYLIVAGTLLGVSFAGADWVGFAVVLAASAASLSGIGIVLGGLVLVIKRGAVVASLFTFFLGLVGGAFFPVSVLPDWLQTIGKVVPTKFAFDGLRAALYQGGGWQGDAVALAAFGVVTLPLAMWLFGVALAYGRRSGTLAQY
jgi:ABC-2 type transport system permease protein